ncbi:MAG: HDOD domain-containing protein [Phycisphaerae bacterium]|nr:HDOD domain-containing protein [Phycisphaerae bacterium]
MSRMKGAAAVHPEESLSSDGQGADERSAAALSIAEKIRDVSTLPYVAIRVNEIANDPSSGAADLKAVLEADPAISARVLRTVNSAAYCPRVRITNLLQAISYLGFNEIRNLAMTASVRQLFSARGDVGQYTQAGLWNHMVSVGVCARMIAMRKELPNFEDAYLAGLLHDFGIILEDEHLPSQFRRMMDGLDVEKTLAENELRFLEFDHPTLGTLVGEQWKFSPCVQAAIGHHHQSRAYQGEDATILHCVELANYICSLKHITSVGVNLVRPAVFAIRALGFGKEDLVVLGQDLDREIRRRSDLFTL